MLLPTLARIIHFAGSEIEHGDSWRDRVRESILDFCYASVCHKLGSSRWSSPILHFLARRGISSKDVRFYEGPEFSNTLAAFAYGCRLLVYYRLNLAFYDHTDGSSSLYTSLQGVHQEYLHDRADAPMGEILSLLAYTLAIAKSTTSRSTIVWGTEENIDTVYYLGNVVSKDSLRDFPRKLVVKLSDILRELLLDDQFNVNGVELATLRDDMTIRGAGLSFLTDARNIVTLRRTQQSLLRRVLSPSAPVAHLYTLVDGNQ